MNNSSGSIFFLLDFPEIVVDSYGLSMFVLAIKDVEIINLWLILLNNWRLFGLFPSDPFNRSAMTLHGDTV